MRKSFCFALVFLGCVIYFNASAQAQSYTESALYTFCSQTNCTDGQMPPAGVIQASDGNFYGTTQSEGANGQGTIFKLTPDGTLTTLYSFCSQSNCTDGGPTQEGLVEGGDGNFYGVTNSAAGANTGGTIYKVTPSGAYTVLYSFCGQTNCTDGKEPASTLVLGEDGNFYGTTIAGGSYSNGTIFKVTPGGTLTTLHSFCSQTGCPDGEPGFASLIQGSDGNFYGTALLGGANNKGTAYQITPTGAFTTLYSFCSLANCADGSYPTAGLIEAADGNLYGTTQSGGSGGVSGCSDTSGSGCGTIFSMTTSGQVTTLYTFCGKTNCTDGEDLQTGIILGSDGNFYGISGLGGPGTHCTYSGDGCGTFFDFTSAGNLSNLYSFCSVSMCTDGGYPQGAIVQGANGNFYGGTAEGGAFTTSALGSGTIFELVGSPSLPAPVQLTFSNTSTAANTPVTLHWKILNGFSGTLQQCYAFVLNNATGAGTWTGLQHGSISDGAFAGSSTITPTSAGFYTYESTCGGMESGAASLSVSGVLLPTSTTVTSNSPVMLNSSISISASVAPSGQNVGTPTGSIAFTYGSMSLGTVSLSGGTASLDLTAANIPAGTYTIKATYSGDQYYAASSGTTNVVILGYATATALSASSSTVIQGQAVTLSANVSRIKTGGTPTGTVTFYAGSLAIGSANLSNGTATLKAVTNGSIPPGTYSVTAKYNGDSSDQASTSPAINLALVAATQTTLTLSKNPVPADSSVTLTAKVKETYGSAVPTGTVSFRVGSDSLGSAPLSAGTASINGSDLGIPPGTYPVTATYSGDPANGSSSATVNVVVQ